MNKRLNVKFFVLLIVIIAILSGAFFIYSLINSNAVTQLQQCQKNCFRIGVALELYANDNLGRYPSDLNVLVPKYIEKNLVCPLNKNKSYSYKSISNPPAFTLFCKGNSHIYCGLQNNFPQYNSKYGIIFNKKDFSSKSYLDELFYTIEMKNCQAAKTLINNHPNILKTEDNSGFTPIHKAAFEGRNDVIELLLEKGIDIDIKNRDNKSPLHYAVINGKLDTTKYLLLKGANINLRDNFNRVPLHEAVSYLNLKVVKELIKKGADINSQDKKGRTPLYIAVNNRSKDIVLFLLNNNADVNIKDTNGDSPISLAKQKGEKEIHTMLKNKIK